MGRETKFLLALLGLLVGVFVGVLSLKLFVPRPPAGTGPDVHADIATVEAQDLVEPPALAPPPAPVPADSDEPDGSRTSRFAVASPGESPTIEPPQRDPFVRPASLDAPLPAEIPAAADLLPPAAPPPLSAPPSLPAPPSHLAPTPPGQPSAPPGQPSALPVQPPAAAATDGVVHIAGPGDSWWSLAERAYGDGRLYRALFAWNKAIEPRVSLTPGTRLEIPTMAKLHMAWPGLVPRK